MLLLLLLRPSSTHWTRRSKRCRGGGRGGRGLCLCRGEEEEDGEENIMMLNDGRLCLAWCLLLQGDEGRAYKGDEPGGDGMALHVQLWLR